MRRYCCSACGQESSVQGELERLGCDGFVVDVLYGTQEEDFLTEEPILWRLAVEYLSNPSP